MPFPRLPHPSEKKYKTLDKDGRLSEPRDLPCWVDEAKRQWLAAKEKGGKFNAHENVEPAEVLISLVIPAYNEEERLLGMLEEAVNFLEQNYGSLSTKSLENGSAKANGTAVRNRKANNNSKNDLRGWEIILVDDGSKDNTLRVAEHFTRTHLIPAHPIRAPGPWTPHPSNIAAVNIPTDAIRLVSLVSNRGKGGAVTHGMRHARGQYVLFADADGASDITDLPKLITAADKAKDEKARSVAVGSRAHMVNSDAVVQRSKLRNFLMHGFHLFLWIMTPPATARIKDTQCGFKLFTRASLPYIIPHMHMEGWIFDVEMLMLAEFASIPVVEVAIGWKEVMGSKLNVVWDSAGMAWNLFLLRLCWATTIYR